MATEKNIHSKFLQLFEGFKISSTKTKAIIFTQKRNLKTDQLNLTMFGQKIEFAKQIKLLGMIFDTKLLWDAHITNLIDRCKKDINLLRLVSATTFGADKLTLLNLYKSLILSKIDYGTQAYFSAQKSSLKKLDLIQNTALRIITGARKTTPINALEVECGLKPLTLRREELILKYWARTSPLGDSLPVNDLIDDFGCYTTKRAREKIYQSYSLTVQELLNEHKITTNISPPDYRDKWDLKHNEPSSDLKNIIGPKNESKPDKIKEISLEYIQNKYKHKLQIYTDGSKDPDKQTSGAAFVIPEHNIQAAYKTNPILSIFTNELIAVERDIEWSIQNNIPETVILTDSLSSVQSLQSGKSHTRPDKINHILAQTDAATTLGISIYIDWIPAHVGIPGNELADAIARSAMTNGTPDHTAPSKSEIYPQINEAIMKKWQQQWKNTSTGHTYQSIQPNIQRRARQYSSNRKKDVIFTRLRLGHNGLKFHRKYDIGDGL